MPLEKHGESAVYFKQGAHDMLRINTVWKAQGSRSAALYKQGENVARFKSICEFEQMSHSKLRRTHEGKEQHTQHKMYLDELLVDAVYWSAL